ncbi:MAG: lipocalin-like domain-containing protein [Pseudomonadota bacterium]
MRLLAALALVLAAPAALAQGYAGLGAEPQEGYAEVRPDREIRFPEDHGPHPEFRIEWWYVTANLEDAEGRAYGLQWTLFRSALRPASSTGGGGEGWASPQFWMAHAAVTSADQHLSAERFARGGIGQAGVAGVPFSAHLDDWRFESTTPAPDAPFAPLHLSARGEDFAYDLTLATDAPPVLQGEAGYSVKSDLGQASHYYSQPFFEAEGTLVIEGREREVRGRAWMDREWSTQPLAPGQSGWDWFALRFGDDTAVMLYRLRQDDGNHYLTGNWIGRDGRSESLGRNTVSMTPLERTDIDGRAVPTHWRIEIPSRDVTIETVPLNAQSWMDTSFEYWEGPIRFAGSHEGVGYLEMTGY